MDDSIAIEFRNLTKVYSSQGGEFIALNNFNLKIEAGRFFGFLGPNGAGKSTAIKCLSSINFITSGNIYIHGYSLIHNPITAKRMMGIVPQEIYADNNFDLLTTLKIQSQMSGVRYEKDWACYLLERLGLYEDRKKVGRELSGGMKRRMMIARALIHRPCVLVLDEPSGDIDVQLRLRVWDFIREVNQTGITIVLTTHNLQEAEELCDHIAILQKGILISNQSKQNLLSLADENFIQIELGQFKDEKDLECFLRKIRIHLPTLNVSTDSKLFRQIGTQVLLSTSVSRGDIESLKNIMQVIAHLKEQYSFEVNNLKTDSDHLENIFLKLLNKDRV